MGCVGPEFDSRRPHYFAASERRSANRGGAERRAWKSHARAGSVATEQDSLPLFDSRRPHVRSWSEPVSDSDESGGTRGDGVVPRRPHIFRRKIGDTRSSVVRSRRPHTPLFAASGSSRAFGSLGTAPCKNVGKKARRSLRSRRVNRARFARADTFVRRQSEASNLRREPPPIFRKTGSTKSSPIESLRNGLSQNDRDRYQVGQ